MSSSDLRAQAVLATEIRERMFADSDPFDHPGSSTASLARAVDQVIGEIQQARAERAAEGVRAARLRLATLSGLKRLHHRLTTDRTGSRAA